jgi:hypothetical protein
MSPKRRPVFQFEVDEDRIVDFVVTKLLAKLRPLLAGKAKLEASAPDMQTLDAFCQANGISKTFAREQIRAGKLKIKKAGKSTMVAREDAEAWRAGLSTKTLPSPGQRKAEENGNGAHA